MNKSVKTITIVWIWIWLLLLASCGIQNNNTKTISKIKTPIQNSLNNNTILTDSEWMTLYIFTKDKKNISNCYGECEVKWPVFYNSKLKDNLYSSITRKDWKMQTTYNGQPIYYFFKDEKPWDMKWEWLKWVWYTIKK